MYSLLDSYANKVAYYDHKPNECPLCHHAIEPKEIVYHVMHMEDFPDLRIIWSCPRNECQEIFITYYTSYNITHDRIEGYSYYKVAPTKYVDTTFTESIKKTSLDFIQIFNQANHAENLGLNQICGPGYRKALEFLIKDYACSLLPADKDCIRAMPLAKCIDKYVSDVNVKKCAYRAAWVGNDETHYTRKWENKDINDLRILIRLTVNWIENEILTREYEADMPER